MKKAKFILAAVAVMAIAGGTLAFKANRGSVDYFTTNSYNAIAPAANLVPNAAVTATGTQRVYWTIAPGTPARSYNFVEANS